MAKARLEKRVTTEEKIQKWVHKNKTLIQLNIFYILIVIFIVFFMTL